MESQSESIETVLEDLCLKFTKLDPADLSLEILKPLIKQCNEFFTSCNKQQLLDDSSFVPMCIVLCRHITEYLVKLKLPILGINVLCKAVEKLQELDSQLTAVHANLFQLCLLAKCFKPSLPFLDIDVTNIHNGIDSKQFLLYYYYGGMIYTAIKNYDRALYFFEACIISIAPAFSTIMVEAFKKYILLCLILKGKYTPLCNYGSAVNKHVKKIAAKADLLNYKNLATACEKSDPRAVEALIEKCSGGFHVDQNLGLVNQVLSSVYKRNIRNLADTFLTLSLSDVAARVDLSGADVAEKYILNMIEDGEIFAIINQEDGVVAFQDNPENYDCPKMLEKLEKEMSQCAELGEKLLEMEESIITTPKFVAIVCGLTKDDDEASLPRKHRTNAN